MKLIIVGNGRIGKTSMMTRFAEGTYSSQYRKTIGTDFLEKKVFVRSIHEQVTFYLYDTAGQEEYNGITKAFYKGSGAAIVAFSTTDRKSFEAVRDWADKVKAECGEIPIVLVQTKTDLMDQSSVTDTEAELLALDLNARLFKICSKENVNVNEVFEQLCFEYVRRRRTSNPETPIKRISDLAYRTSESDHPPSVPDETPPTSTMKDRSKRFSTCLIMYSQCVLRIACPQCLVFLPHDIPAVGVPDDAERSEIHPV